MQDLFFDAIDTSRHDVLTFAEFSAFFTEVSKVSGMASSQYPLGYRSQSHQGGLSRHPTRLSSDCSQISQSSVQELDGHFTSSSDDEHEAFLTAPLHDDSSDNGADNIDNGPIAKKSRASSNADEEKLSTYCDDQKET